MAEAMARSMGGGRVAVYSAGLSPLGRIENKTLSTLIEMGYSIDGLWSKGIGDVPLDSIDVIVSLIGRHALHLVPTGVAARREGWSIRDPYGDDEEVYLAVARTLESRVRALVDEYLSETPHPRV